MKIWQKLLAVGFILIVVMIANVGVVFAFTVTCCTDTTSQEYVQGCGKCCNKVDLPNPDCNYCTAIQCNTGEVCDVGVSPAECKTPGSPVTATPNPTNTPGPTTSAVPTTSPYDPCKNAAGNARPTCEACKTDGTWTAIGCLENEPAALVGHLIGIGGGIAGGLAFLLMLWGAAQLVLSQGVPEKIQAAKDTITSAVIGLVFIFLSVLILKLIGVQILGIPGWS